MSDFDAPIPAGDQQRMTLNPIVSCGGGTCPAIYRTTRGTFVIQGRAVPVEQTDVTLAPDELLVEIPEDLIAGISAQPFASP